MVNALILNNLREVLLTHNCKNGSDRYEFCGGKVQNNEDLEQATIRENLEELGIIIETTGIFGDYKTSSPEGNFFCRTYYARIIDGNPEPKEFNKMDWCGYVNYNRLWELNEKGVLVPNLSNALPRLKHLIS